MEKIDKAIEILTAFKEGKTIECYSEITDTWWRKIKEYGELITILSKGDELKLRIAKEPTYRPYANAEEFLKASKEHGPYLYRNWSEGQLYIPTAVFNKEPFRIRVHGNTLTADSVYREFTWQDGTPCGILEQ